MKKLLERLAAAASAAAFAEEGDAETARAIMRERQRDDGAHAPGRAGGPSHRRGAGPKRRAHGL